MRIGIDLGGTKIEGILLDEAGAEVLRRRVPTPRDQGYEAIVDAVATLARELSVGAASGASIGVGIPGTVSRETGLVKNANTTCLIGHPLDADLAAALGRPVRVANDANCFAVAEARGGAAMEASVVFGVILGTGVGGGLVVDGRARVGAHGIAGEWGHSPIADHDPAAPPAPLCYCGQHGCIETRLSGPALEADYARLAGAGPREVDAAQIAARAAGGEVAARQALSRYVAFLGEGLARIIHILDPHVIVLGGGLSNIEMLYAEAPRAIERVLFSERLLTPIRRNQLGDSAGVYGAAWLWDGTSGAAPGAVS